MTDTTAAAPRTIHGSTPLAVRRFTESMSMFVDPPIRAYVLGLAQTTKVPAGGSKPGISEVLRAILDDAMAGHQAANAEDFERVMTAGRAEVERRRQ